MDFRIIHIEETDSTNRWLKENGEGNMVVVADYQTAGKGCGTNSWESERGKNLTFSMLIHPTDIPASRQFRITEIISVAICEVLEQYIGDVSIKWPNDIYWRNGKLGGILIENALTGNQIRDCIIGVGLNVNQRRFLSGAPNPVSLWQISEHETDCAQLLDEILAKFGELVAQDVRPQYLARLYRRQGYHPFVDQDGAFMAELTGVEEDGHLLKYMARFNRILLKLSGESLMGKQGYGIDPERLSDYAKQIKEISEMGVQIGIVIGGGNIFRGLSGSQKGFDRVKGDQMGMCATVINSLALSSALGAIGVKNKVLTAIRMEPIGEFYTKWKAIEAMEAGYVCIFSAGTGSPYFTTDTGSSLRGIEIEADVMLKGTRVDGVYTADPEKDPTATKFDDRTTTCLSMCSTWMWWVI